MDKVKMHKQDLSLATEKNSKAYFIISTIIVLAVAITVWLIAKQPSALETDKQKIVYPLFSSILLGSLTALWLLNYASPKTNSEPQVWYYPLLGGALTLIISSLAFIYFGIWPIGGRTILTIDLRHQYAPFLTHLRNILLHGGNPFYSFNIGAGSNFYSLFFYYLASPLNILLILCPSSYMAEGIFLIVQLKLMLASIFMAIFLQYLADRRTCVTSMVGMMYALSMYMLAYFWNIMWLDAVALTPLCLIGFERMMRKGAYSVYVICLACTLITSYYIGFMVCLFLVLYFLVYAFREKRTTTELTVSFIRFVIGSLLGGGLAMASLIPSVLALRDTSAAIAKLPSFETYFSSLDVFGRSLISTSPVELGGNLPNIYCGILTILSVPLFATMREIPLRRRIVFLLLVVIMGLSLIFKLPNLLWHGLHIPRDMPHRFAFLYCLSLLLICFDVMLHIQKIRLWQIIVTLYGILGCLILLSRGNNKNYSTVSIYLSFAFIGGYVLVMLAAAHKKLTEHCVHLLMLIIVVAEMLINASSALQLFIKQEPFVPHDQYFVSDRFTTIQSTVDVMKAIGAEKSDEAFFRIEFAPHPTFSDPFLFDYHGISVFSTTYGEGIAKFMKGMGIYSGSNNKNRYQNFVPTVDSLMGLRYIATDKKRNYPLIRKLPEGTSSNGTYHIYENPYALPLAFMTNSALKDWTYPYPFTPPIEMQNSFFTAATGNTAEVMIPLLNIKTEDKNENIPNAPAFRINGARTETFTATVIDPGYYYVYVDCTAAKNIRVTSGRNAWNITPNRSYFVYVGALKENDKIKVAITTSRTSSTRGSVYISRLAEDVFKEDIAWLAANGLHVTSFSDSSISGTIHAERGGILCTTIPYDDGWTVKVDGQKIETFAIGGALLGVEMDAGDHQVSFTFRPIGLTIGVFLTIISLALFILLLFVRRRHLDSPVKQTQLEASSQEHSQE